MSGIKPNTDLNLYDVQGWMWIFWIIVLSLFTLSLGTFAIWQIFRPLNIPVEEVLESEIGVALISKGVPDDVIRAYYYLDDDNIYYLDDALVPVSDNMKLKVYLPESRSIKGEWYGENPTISFDIPFSIDKISTETDDFSILDSGDSIRTVKPFVRIDFPKIDENLYHQYLSAEINLSIQVPVFSGANEYQEERRELSRKIELFFVTKEDLELLNQTIERGWFSEGQEGSVALCVTPFILATLIGVLVNYKLIKAFIKYKL